MTPAAVVKGLAGGTAMLVAVLLALVAGLWLGLHAGAFNARIDVCDDDTSAWFFQDAAVRAASCEDL